MSDKAEAKCKLLLDVPGLAPGWGCCNCKTYNNILRAECKYCTHERCDGSEVRLVDVETDPEKLN